MSPCSFKSGISGSGKLWTFLNIDWLYLFFANVEGMGENAPAFFVTYPDWLYPSGFGFAA